MNALLVVATLISMGLALAMSVVAWRATVEARRRAAARVAALSAAAGVPAAPAPAEAVGAGAAPGLQAFESEHRASGGNVGVHTGFLGSEPAVASAGPQRALALAAAVLAIALGAVAYSRMDNPPAPQQAASPSAPLELLSLRHDREGGHLSVAGLVRNPPAGPVVERVSAVVLLFDQEGTFVTSATAPLDFLKLTAGDESPFVVKVQAPSTVARYRVSFRTGDGTLPHVDRRTEAPLASPVTLAR